MLIKTNIAPYAYHLVEQDKIIIIYERSHNEEISLTNSIEQVITEIEQKRGFKLDDFTIVQCNNYDEYDIVNLSTEGRPSWKYLHHTDKDGKISTLELITKIRSKCYEN